MNLNNQFVVYTSINAIIPLP